jgi:hypothetical protein
MGCKGSAVQIRPPRLKTARTFRRSFAILGLMNYDPGVNRRNHPISLFVLSLIVLLAACTPAAAPTQQTEPSELVSFPGEQVKLLSIALPAANLVIGTSLSDTVDIESASAGAPFSINLDEAGQLSITRDAQASTGNRSIPPHLRVALPSGIGLQVSIDDGVIELEGISGDIRVQTTSADIAARSITGLIWIRTARGQIAIRDSLGELHLIGEGRKIAIEDCHGDVAATTIMGEIEVAGLLVEGDRFHMESDHGAVQIGLDRQSSVELTLVSVNGQIQCTIPGLTGTGADCSRTYGDGAATIEVRTVTGPIRITSRE